MAAKQQTKTKNGKVRVTFKMLALDGCDCLCLVGEFDEWNETAHPMQRAADGTWSLTLELKPGRDYQYRYRTDTGVWHTDPTADVSVPNPYGFENSVVST
jgi:1,4-alpha-glucan branching enzyme